MWFFYCGATAPSISVFIGFICFNKNWNGPVISELASLKKKIYPIFGKVLCRTLKLIIVFKDHFHYGDYSTHQFWWEISQRERGNSARCVTLNGVSVLQPRVWSRGIWETALLRWAATFCLQCASSLDREKQQWDKCQMASSVTPYGMPLIVARRRPFTATSGGKTGVSWL